MIFDTDILVWFLRNKEKAVDLVVKSVPFSISIVSYMELIQGMRNKQELELMKKAFKDMDVDIIPLSEKISLDAAKLVEKYALSHSMQMADALIASTCLTENRTFFTANDKHYKFIEGLQMNVFRP